MAPLTEADKGDFKNKQFAENEVADKVVEQCEIHSILLVIVVLRFAFFYSLCTAL